MEFGYSHKVQALQGRVKSFIQELVLPAESAAHEHNASNPEAWGPPPIMEDLKSEAKRRDLWNLFLPEDDRGAGLSNLEYAPIAELTGWSPSLAPEALNCSPPDTGNIELLSRFGHLSSRKTG